MKQIYASILFLMFVLSTNAQVQFWTPTVYKGAFPVTDNSPTTDWTYGWSNWDPENTAYPNTSLVLNSDITTDMTLSGVVLLTNKVYVKNGATLTILPGTIIRGDYSTQGTLIITRGSKIFADGNELNPIVFTSNNPVGQRAEGDWGGLVLLGNAVNNQPGGVANIEGIVPTNDTQHGGNNDNDNSGILRYVRVEFAGIPLEPNKEINGVTFGSVGNQTLVDYVQVSFSGDDSFEWFGGTVNCKHLISYSTTDDDFDTDFGYRGKVQFGLAIRNENLSDAAGDSNCFESDNDAQGSVAQPLTSPVFSNFTLIGAKGDGTVSLPIGEKFEKAFRLRRNTATSVFNTIVTGWEKGVSLEGTAVEDNLAGDTMQFHSNILSNFNSGTVCLTTTSGVLNTYFSQHLNDSISTIQNINWVTPFTPIGLTPDYRLNDSSIVATGANFPLSVFGDLFSGIKTIESRKLNVYPNPTNGNIYFSENVNNFVIYNSTGNVVKQNDTNLSNLSNGVYFIKVNENTYKVSVQK